MFCYLSELSDYFGPLRLFDYVSFRAGGAFVFSFFIVALLGGKVASLLKKYKTASADRYAGLFPPEYISKLKNSTPSMGGLLLIGAVMVSSVLWTDISGVIAPVFIASMGLFALIGFADDYIKLKNRDGLSASVKFISTAVVAGAAFLVLRSASGFGELMDYMVIPFVKNPVYVGWFAWIISILAVLGTVHGANLTDGKDGLVSGCAISSSLAYTVIAYIMSHKIFSGYLNVPFLPGAENAVIFGMAICGACMGFLWHNCQPASMFMGDTGSLPLGGAIAMLAVLTRQEILLILVGGVFVIEAASTMIQIYYFKLTGNRVFLCAPIHHHFERKDWKENQIVIRFWILSWLFALLALATLKLR